MFRIGGDEFALIVNGAVTEGFCKSRVEKIKAAIREPYRLKDAEVQVGTSCGCAVYPCDSDDVRASASWPTTGCMRISSAPAGAASDENDKRFLPVSCAFSQNERIIGRRKNGLGEGMGESCVHLIIKRLQNTPGIMRSCLMLRRSMNARGGRNYI